MTCAITKYLPSAWLDEINPEPQADPTAFLNKCAEPGCYLMEPVDDPEDWESRTYHVDLQPGHVVPFLAHRHYGMHIMTVAEDGSADAPTVPADANCFCIETYWEDTFCESIAELAKQCIEGDFELGEVEIQAWFWSDTETHFRLVEQDGNAVFEPCAGPN